MEIETFFLWTDQKLCVGLSLTRNGVKLIDKKIEAMTTMLQTQFPKRGTKIYKCNKLLPGYVAKAVTYVSAFN